MGDLPPPAAPPGSVPPSSEESLLVRFGGAIERDQSGMLGLLTVVGVGMVMSYLLWPLFALPAGLINDVVPDAYCTNEIPGTSAMRTCAFKAGLVKMIGPMVVVVVVLLIRKPFARWSQALAAKLPPGLRPLVAPLLATLLFLLVWAGTHKETGNQSGLLPQKAFPAVIGAYTYVILCYRQQLQSHLSGFLDRREKWPFALRVVITLAIPTVISLVITNQERVSQTALKEQVVVIIGLIVAYLMLVPRGGDVGEVAKRVVGENAAP